MKFVKGQYGEEMELNSGRRLHPNCGIIGITERFNEESSELQVFDGFDGGLDHDLAKPFTREERQEISAYVISLWERFATAELDEPREF